MRYLGQLADWWDGERRATIQVLDDWEEDTRGALRMFAVAVAGAVQTAMDLGQGFVDVLRLGWGVRQGTVGGVAHDALRLPTVAGPVAREVRLSSRALARFCPLAADAQPAAGVCTWVGGANALRTTGVRHGATATDAAAVGRESIHLAQLVPTLRTLGANPIVAQGVQTVQALIEFTRQAARSGGALGQGSRGGVSLFSIFWHHPQQNATVVHMMGAFIDGLGRFCILDRTGQVFGSLAEMESLHPGISNVTGWGSLLVHVPEALWLRVAGAASVLEMIGFEMNSVVVGRPYATPAGAGASTRSATGSR